MTRRTVGTDGGGGRGAGATGSTSSKRFGRLRVLIGLPAGVSAGGSGTIGDGERSGEYTGGIGDGERSGGCTEASCMSSSYPDVRDEEACDVVPEIQ
jgi:hypothetical protein